MLPEDFESLEQIEELCKRPISEANPLGELIRMNPDLNAIQRTIANYSPGPNRVTGDEREPEVWQETLVQIVNMLSRQTKDIRLLCWLVGALANTSGLEGVAVGLRVLTHFLEQHGAELHPNHVRTRANALTWLGRYLTFWGAQFITDFADFQDSTQPLTREEAAPVLDASSAMEEFYQAALDAYGEEQRYDFTTLREFKQFAADLAKIAKARLKIPRARPQAEPAQEPEKPEELARAEKPAPPAREESPPAPAPAAAAEQPTPVAAAEEETADRASLLLELAQLAHRFRAAAPGDPVGFRMLRLAKWSLFEQLPSTRPESRRTWIAGPRGPRQALEERAKSNIDDTASGAAALAFIELCERWFNDFPLWLDLQLLIHRTAAAVGLHAIAEVIAQETAALLRRLGPELLELEFDDGTPFAGPEARPWAAGLLTAGPAPAARSSPPPAAPARPPAAPVPAAVPLQIQVGAAGGGDGLDAFLTEQVRLLAQGRHAAVLGATAQRVASEEHPLNRWRLLRLAGLAAAGIPSKRLLARAILETCRSLAEQTTLRTMMARELSEVLVALRDLGDDGGENLDPQTRRWLETTGKALALDPGPVLLAEAAALGGGA